MSIKALFISFQLVHINRPMIKFINRLFHYYVRINKDGRLV